jgi:amino acid adenylation domain-containing protein/non-ribosomal peptide synthase protein (TIGR01720 family)
MRMQGNTLSGILMNRKVLRDKGITFIEGNGQEDFLSYSELYEAALRGLYLLQQKGLKPGNELVFQVEDYKIFLVTFWSCILGGIIPVPLTVGQNDEHRQKLFNVWPVLNNAWLITSISTVEKLGVFAKQKGFDALYTQMSANAVDESSILSSGEQGIVFNAKENDIAFIQFSSGSTGSPKGVVLTHKNLITNTSAISHAARYTANDSTISWMPLTHDMGLIGFHLNPLVEGMQQYLVPTPAFIRRPALWMDKASEHKVSILCSPNFGYKYLLKHVEGTGQYNWDLSNVRIIYNGAEPISEKLCYEFLDKMADHKLKRRAMCPVYGLAEATLAVSISGLEDEVISLAADRNKLNVGDEISLRNAGENTVSFVNVGRAINNCTIRIADKQGKPVKDEVVGHVHIKGEAVTSGYYNNAAETKKTISKDGWLNTGDLGFVSSNALYITGRAKDVIFVNGQNFYSHDLERVAEEVAGVELNKIVITGYLNVAENKDETIAFVFHRGELASFLLLSDALKAHINNKIGFQLDKVIAVKDIPKTTSGKLQRFKLVERYLNGEFEEVEQQLNLLVKERKATVNVARPSNETEEALLQIWKQLLRVDDIGINERFFEAGGNSLKAAEMSMQILKKFGVEPAMDLFYEKGTIAEIAAAILHATPKNYEAIPQASARKYYPASSAQKRLYYFWELDKTSTAYNVPVAFSIKGSIDYKKLEECLRQLVARHDSLRMSFHADGEPVFQVHETVDFKLNIIECSENDLNDALKNRVQPFDLSQAPLFRMNVLKMQNGAGVLFIDFHHIISDGVSVYYFLEELTALYNRTEILALPAQFKDFACWEKEKINSDKIATEEKYWLEQLQGELPVLELPIDFKRPIIFDAAGEKLSFSLGKDVTAQLKQIAVANGCTLHVLLFAAYNILLSKYTGQEDLVVGIPVAGRTHPDIQRMQGMFVNNLAIRSHVSGDRSFEEFLKKQSARIKEALNNQNYPFYNLTRSLGAKRDVSRNPVFDTMFIYQNMGFPVTNTNDFSLSPHFFDPGFSKFDVSMEVFDHEEALQYNIEYATSLFRKETILRMASHFENLVNNIIADLGARLANLSIISQAESEEYINGFNATVAEYPEGKTIHQLFEAQVAATPGNIAIEYNGDTLTYKQLNERADQLAMLLRQKEIAPNIIVGILLHRSPALLISILAVLKAGGCYLPMDTDLPAERIEYLLTNSHSKLLIVSNESAASLQHIHSTATEVINIDKLEYTAAKISKPAYTSAPSNLAYVIYTSGTTGRPKGVMIEHRSLVNYITWAAKHYVQNEEVAFPLFTSISFDLTVTSIFVPLLTGNKIVVYKDDGKDLMIERLLNDNKADVIKLTPSHLKIIADSKLSGKAFTSKKKRFIVGGEQLESWLAKSIHDNFNGHVEIYNEYGPTETTVGCMIHQFNPNENFQNVPIGIPAANTQIYLLDKYLNPVAAGVKGEMYISGDGVARGYLFNDELTRQKFVSNPFVHGRKMYKTGDVARLLPNGIIEYLGRSDQQVKINGYRIELPEIEHHLMSHPGVHEALVVVRKNKKEQKNLCAYYKSEHAIEEALLRNYLSDRLPHYMIPVHFIQIEQIPLTKNGKVDYDALPAPGNAEERKTLLPGNEVEQLMLNAWQEVLGENDLSVTDNFFELGGDSIKAVQIVMRLLNKGLSLRVKDILTYHTIEQISLHAEITDATDKYEQGIVSGAKGLTPIEAWFFAQQFNNPGYFNQSVLLRMNRQVDKDLLQQAFQKLVEHHDGLRMNYDVENKVLFYNNEHLKVPFVIEEQINKQFDITTSLLIRAAIINEMLFITAHHLVIDGLSWRILLEDLHAIYNGLALPAKTATLIDWEKKLAQYTASNTEAYWSDQENTAFTLPVDEETSDWRTTHVQSVTHTLNEEATEFLLKDAHKTYKTDVPILLNTALALTLKQWTGQNTFVVEQENYGRHLDNIDTSRTVGWFTAMYPVKLELQHGSIGDQIKTIKELIRKIPEQGIGYGINKYYRQTHFGKQQLSEIRFNYLGQFEKELNNDMFTYTGASTGSDIDPENVMTTRLELISMVIDGRLIMEARYNSKAHAEATIRWFMDAFFNNLHLICEHIKNEDELHFTPSDFSVELDQEELDALFH